MLIVTIPLSLVKTYTYLSYVSMSGIACTIVGGIMMIGYCSSQISEGKVVDEPMKVFDPWQFFGYVGIAMFSFEGNGIVINLKAEARDKKKYPSLLRWSILTIIIWYMIISTIAYATYRGMAGKVDYITSLLPIGPLTIVINSLFCVNALTSYPV
jgi:amino acid permease